MACISTCGYAHSQNDMYEIGARNGANALFDNGNRCMAEGKMDSSTIYFTTVVNKYGDRKSKDNGSVVANSLINLGYIYTYHYVDYARAYSCLTKAISIGGKSPGNRNLCAAYLNIANIYLIYYSQNGNQEMGRLSLEHYRKAYRSASDTKNHAMQAVIYANMLATAYEMRRTEWIGEEVRDFSSIGSMPSAPLFGYAKHLSRAVAYARKHLTEKAVAELELARKAVPEGRDSLRYVMQAMNIESIICERNSQPHRAIEILVRMMETAQGSTSGSAACLSENSDILADIFTKLAVLYRKQGQEAKGDEYYVKALRLCDTVRRQNNLAEIENMHFLGKLREGEERYRQIVHEKEWQQMLMYGAIIVAMLAAAIMIVLWRGMRREKRLNHELWLRNEEIIHGIGPKYQNSSLDEDSKSEIVDKILHVLSNDDAIYSYDFSINELASRTDMDYHYVSQVINEKMGKTFYALLSEYRIREACHRLDDNETYGNYTIEGIANSVGFKSRSNFVSTFKRLTGLTPSEYRKQARGE